MSLYEGWIKIDIHRPTKFLPIICAVSSHECTVRLQPDPWEKNPVFSVDGVQVYITMEDTWSGWQDNGNIMDPGPNIHRIAASEVTDRQKTKFPSPGPHTWGYSTVWCCVLRIGYSWSQNLNCAFHSGDSFFTPRLSVVMLNWLFRSFSSVSSGIAQV